MYATTLTHKELVVGDIWSFTFAIPKGFSWHAGQHTVVMINNEARALSMATAFYEG